MKKSITLSKDELIKLEPTLSSAIAEEDDWYEYYRMKGLTNLAQDAFNKVSMLKKLHDFVQDTILQNRTTVKLSQEELP